MKLKDLLTVTKGNYQVIDGSVSVVEPGTNNTNPLCISADDPRIQDRMNREVKSIYPALKISGDAGFIQILDIVLAEPSKSNHEIVTFEHELKQY